MVLTRLDEISYMWLSMFYIAEQPYFDAMEVNKKMEEITIYYKYRVRKGSPEVHDIKWTINGKILDLKNKKYVGGSLTDHVLTIKSPKKDDWGTYSCIVTNAVGSVSNIATIEMPRK